MRRNQAPLWYILYTVNSFHTQHILSISCYIGATSSPSHLVVKLPQEESTQTTRRMCQHCLLCTLTPCVSLLKELFFPPQKKKKISLFLCTLSAGCRRQARLSYQDFEFSQTLQQSTSRLPSTASGSQPHPAVHFKWERFIVELLLL